MNTVFTTKQILDSKCGPLNQHLFNEDAKIEKRSKYGNKKVLYQGINFSSKRECARYIVLQMRVKIGEIKDLQCQVPFEINEGGTHSLKYIADFTYTIIKTGENIVEDSKGFRNKVYLKKRKLMFTQYGITILET